jgi:serine/threonine protein kinase
MIIRGRWNKSSYLIERKLGEGANGHVYLVVGGMDGKQVRYALKVGFSSSDLQSEINLLKKLAPTVNKKPFFIDADDYMDGEDVCSFYVMQYVQGITMSAFIEKKGTDWLYLTGFYLLSRLTDIHKRGFAFCDVKPSNVVVSAYGQVELIDYGGASPFGNSVRQFTEMYDRGYWNCGSRSADSGYDLFAFCLVFMQLAGAALPGKGEVLLPQNRTKSELYQAIKDSPTCDKIAPVLFGMINGTYVDSVNALEDWRKIMHTIGVVPPPKHEIKIPWLGGLAVASVLFLTISIYINFN